jgi:adenylyl-sulfate kinase
MTNQKGAVLWFTGLSGSGKSTLSRLIETELRKRGCKVEVLDGDEVRENLSKGLGFSKEDRDTNIRRIGYVAKLLARNGVITITAAISPYKAVRDQVRAIPELTRRDVKGLYAKALAGEIKNFTGVSDPYEAPENPEIKINSETQDEAESLAQILGYLEKQGFIPATAGAKA